MPLDKLFGWRVPVIAGVWGVSLFAVLQIQYLPLDASHSVCGRWGCGPPLPPLIAYHGFWLVLLSLPTAILCRALTPARLRTTGWILLAVGLSGFALVGMWEMVPSLPLWLPRVRHLPPRYYMQRYLLSVATLVDVPIVPLTIAGLCCVLSARRRRERVKQQTQTAVDRDTHTHA